MKRYWVEQTLITEKEFNAPWLGNPRKYFRCGFCGHYFQIGETYRWQYTNSMEPKYCGNPLVCSKCDQGDEKNKEIWKEKCDLFYSDTFWYLVATRKH